MISFDQAIGIHAILIERFGGVSGIRDRELLDSAISRPAATFDSLELYPGSAEKAAAIIESIVKNHPFIDGNKRTGYTLMRLVLLDGGFDIDEIEDEKYIFVTKIAEDKLNYDEILSWIKSRLKGI